jgi:predicted RNase H-like HicB family nuclease
MARQMIHAVIFKDAESDQWVAKSLEYDVTTQGESEEHAKAMLKEAVAPYLEDRFLGELEILSQRVEGEPRLHTLSIDAPSLLRS